MGWTYFDIYSINEVLFLNERDESTNLDKLIRNLDDYKGNSHIVIAFNFIC